MARVFEENSMDFSSNIMGYIYATTAADAALG